MPEYKLCLLDIDYIIENERPVIRIFGRTDKGKSIVCFDKKSEPYFYVLCSDLKKVEKKLKDFKPREYHIEKIENVEKIFKGKKQEFLKLYTRAPSEVPPARDSISSLAGVEEVLEADILFARRYVIDKKLQPMSMISVKGKPVKSNLKVDLCVEIEGSPKVLDKEIPKLKVMSFDIEAYGKTGVPQPDKNPIIMLSMASDKFEKILTYKKIKGIPGYVEVVENENKVLGKFDELIAKHDIDILTGYNTDQFDLPYIRDRSERIKYDFKPGRGGERVKFRSKGPYHAAKISGRVHIDLYHYVNYILRGALREVSKRTLKSIASAFLPVGEEKKELDWDEMFKAWDNGSEDLKELFEYSINDAVITKKLADLFLPREYEIAKLVRVPLFDSSRMTYGQLVESTLMWNAFERGELFPNRPSFDLKTERASSGMYEGAYVKEPEKGMHENVALFDFRSLYPTIIISHNVDPDTLDCECCAKSSNKVPGGKHWFCKKEKGLIPSVLKGVIERRVELKEKMKRAKKDSLEYKKLDNEQYALKILANSAYGYMGYRGARWYSRDCASSVTAFGRMYIQKIIDLAPKFGLRAIYGDTDSLFVVAEKGGLEVKIKKFQKAVNKELPGVMELEFEGIYKRGIFVTKKRYALIDKEGKTSIKGLEFVRRDWSPLAKDTQKQVLEALLKDGSPERAFKIVREVIKKIKSGEVAKEDLAVYTALTRPLEDYQVTAPHIAAAHRLKKKGKDVHTGTLIGYIIIKGGGKISERSIPVEDVKFENYDKSYYIEHQILPAVSRVMEALGYSEEELLGKKQGKLGEYFK